MNVSNALIFNRQKGRLQALETIFQQDNRVFLTGNDGAGKTTLAQEYMRCFADKYQAMIRINAATDETFLADLCEALQRFSLPVDMTGSVMEIFQTLHNYLNEQSKALLILDHLPFRFAVQDSPDQQPLRYHFLLITHTAGAPAELPRLDLAGLEARDGALLVLRQAGLLAEQDALLDTAGNEVQMDALELAREMQGSPIALRLAGGYLRQVGLSIRDYLDLFREYPVRLQLHGNGPQGLDVAGELSLAWLARTHPEALAILWMCALLSPEAIPIALLDQGDEEKAEQTIETIQLLVALGLLNKNEDRSVLSMHPLIQQLTRQFCELDEQPQPPELLEPVLRRLRSLLSTLSDQALPARLRIAGHIRQLATQCKQWKLTITEAAEVFGWAATLLWEQKMLSQAEALLRRALEIWEKVPEISQITIVTALERLATLNGQLGNYDEAESLSQRAIVGMMATKGLNHPDVLLALNQLGQYYAAQNKQNEAKASYEKVIEMGEMLKLRQHPVYSTAKYNLALLSIEQGQFGQAEDLLLRVCTVWSHMLGEHNRSTVEARLKLAEVAARLKHWERANSCYEQALPPYEEELGKENPLVLNHLGRAAMALFQLGRLEEAKRLWLRVLAVNAQIG
ncbi:MAG TPA: tetratricopeptide repeat protein, partial [Ktedonobacteraceae bacterium]|nr:tetratricopeptide repeat protein [Ktedonobacteraceae bacterium]